MGLTISILLNIILLIITFGQSKTIAALRQKMRYTKPVDMNDDFYAAVKAKMETVGDVKTVKFLREEYHLSMIDAKQLVDSLKEPN